MMRPYLFLLFLCALPFSAHTELVQTVFPEKLFVGDTAEIRCALPFGIDFLGADGADELPLSVLALLPNGETADFTLKTAALQRNGNACTAVLTVVPWRTGEIDIPPLDLSLAVSALSDAPHILDPQPFSVDSLVAEGDALRGMLSPLLLPGTLYALYAGALLLLALVIAFVKLFAARAYFVQAFTAYRESGKCRRNAKKAIRQLKKLLKKDADCDDAAFCLDAQRVMRSYLTVRFGRDFTALAASELPAALDAASGGFLDGAKGEAAESVTSFFIRTDYIRFAKGSADSAREPPHFFAAAFRAGERTTLLASLKEAIYAFDGNGRGRLC